MSVNDRWDNEIRNAIASLERHKGDWVPLVDLRPKLDRRGTSRAAQDKHFKRLSQERKIHLVPESNRKALRAADHAAAVRVGGDDNHVVCWVGPR
ncbi:hypothetical protein [Amycolatopsis orientalis]|uniref:hypothetical protein n=1 Tax=Amycolatopsis orientalis TaxID=31958 RepID=UPI00068874CF|nr:hypothetical protein [Amycolatopsis orientalis]